MSEQEHLEEMKKTYKKRSKALRTSGLVLNSLLVFTSIVYFVLEFGFPEMGEFKSNFEIITDSLLHFAFGAFGTFELIKWFKNKE